jgi:hypothetical protein
MHISVMSASLDSAETLSLPLFPLLPPNLLLLLLVLLVQMVHSPARKTGHTGRNKRATDRDFQIGIEAVFLSMNQDHIPLGINMRELVVLLQNLGESAKAVGAAVAIYIFVA